MKGKVMGNSKDSRYNHLVEKQYEELMDYCQVTMDRMERELPEPKFNLRETLKDYGVSRRDFIKWSSVMTTALMLPKAFSPMVARAAENFSRLPVIWIHLAECTGCSEAFLRNSYPNVDDILLETISLEYHETVMAAAGYQAEENLHNAMDTFNGKYICVVEGAIPTGLKGKYLTLGPQGKTGLEVTKEVTSRAAATICIGSCSSYGNVQAAAPNPTDAKGITDALGVKTVNIPGCPPNGVNFTGTVLYYLLFANLPPTDGLGRPLWAYGMKIHDNCERRAHYDAGEFVEEWGDKGAMKGWCLYKMGCKGPYTYSNCSVLRFNDRMSWPIMGGHGCMGCTEPAFWDAMAPLEKPIADKPLPGFGIESNVDKVGAIATGVAAVGLAAHAGASVWRKGGEEEPKKGKAKK
jgi:quinone-reactive Ni/Fe-hydrogenase small subunit